MRPLHVLHRFVWQRLPYHWRRATLFRAAALMAPHPSAVGRAVPPLVVAGALSTASGLGQSARLCHDALKEAGFEVYGIDLTRALMQPLDYPTFAFKDGREVMGPGTVVLHVNGPFVPLAMLRLGRRLVQHKRVIGYWAWELPCVPPDWRHGVPFVHEIWVPSRFTADAVRVLAPNHPVSVMAHPVAINEQVPTQCEQHDPGRPFNVLTIFNMASSFARKNPCAAICAFRQAFGFDRSVRLTVKYTNGDAFPEGIALMQAASRGAANVVFLGDTLSSSEVAALYAEADVVLSLHRSEGFGLTIAEAMLHGMPVIATNWSGSCDFLTEETGVPIPYRLVSARDLQGTYDYPGMAWANADVTATASALRRLRDDPALRRRLGANARAQALRLLSTQAYAERILQKMEHRSPNA